MNEDEQQAALASLILHHREVEHQNEMMGAQLAALIARNGGGPIRFTVPELEAMLDSELVLNSDAEGDEVVISLITAEEAVAAVERRRAKEGMH